MVSKYLIICFALLLLPSIFTSIRVFLRLFRLSYNKYHKRSIQMAVSIISHVILSLTCSHPNFIPMGTAFLKITNNFYFTNLFLLPNLSVLWGRVDYFFVFEILHFILFGILNMIRLGFSLNSLGTSLKSLFWHFLLFQNFKGWSTLDFSLWLMFFSSILILKASTCISPNLLVSWTPNSCTQLHSWPPHWVST